MSIRPIELTRREALLAAAAGVGLAAVRGGREMRTKRVLLVAFAGGVRSRETIETPSNVPNLMRLASEGVVLPDVRTQNVGHYGAALSIFTGTVEVKGIRENARGSNPTIFEVLRKKAGLSANDVWLSATGGPQALNYAYSLHPEYGSKFGANLISGDGVFNAEFQSLLEQFGRPRARSEAEAALLERLRAALGPQPASESASRVEKFVLDEIAGGGTARVTGPNASDARALRVARNVLRVFKPRMLGIHLGNCDVAHRSFNNYVEVIRRNDEALGAILDDVRADADLRDTTSVFVLPEFGRDRDLNERNGLDHGDGSEELLRISAVAWGPDFKKGKTIRDPVDWTAIAPTVAHLFGVEQETAASRPIRALFA